MTGRIGPAGALAGIALLAVASFSAAAATAGPAAAAANDAPVFEQPAPGTPNLTGKWAMPKLVRHLLTADGKEPPLNAAGKAEYAKRQAALQAGNKKVDPIRDCIMHGTPRLLYAPYPFLILQTTRSVNFVHEANHTFRIIYWDKSFPDDPDPDYLGYSIAHFDGPTLVIDTIGLNDKTWLDYSGLPHGEKLKVQERYTLSDPNTIKGSVTLTDPDYYTAPWTTPFTLKKQPGMNIKENVCTDTHQM
ncbi:MAG TPA: hypothetical protein VNY82_02285 [Steroidobacteraceae bacterium]|nr:hypothetical protein [Steroidobacteraceae bacterium]